MSRSRMYRCLPNNIKKDIPPLLFGDNQLGTAVKDFYADNSFCRNDDSNINLWKLFNLFNGANKSSYIDDMLNR